MFRLALKNDGQQIFNYASKLLEKGGYLIIFMKDIDTDISNLHSNSINIIFYRFYHFFDLFLLCYVGR